MTVDSLQRVASRSNEEQELLSKRSDLYKKHFELGINLERKLIKSVLWSDNCLSIRIIPFSWQGCDDVWEDVFGSGVLSPHWPLTPNKVLIEKDGEQESFSSVNAAYQSMKRWNRNDIREAFSDAYTPEEVISVKQKYHSTPYESDFNKYSAMMFVLQSYYFSVVAAASVLLSTDGCFLLYCHSSPISVSHFWSDGNAAGENNFGRCLMTIRDQLNTHRNRPVTSWPAGLRESNWFNIVTNVAPFCRQYVEGR